MNSVRNQIILFYSIAIVWLVSGLWGLYASDEGYEPLSYMPISYIPCIAAGVLIIILSFSKEHFRVVVLLTGLLALLVTGCDGYSLLNRFIGKSIFPWQPLVIGIYAALMALWLIIRNRTMLLKEIQGN